jgi:hypothetical protein
MSRLHAASLASFLIFISGCSSDEREKPAGVQFETGQILLKLQQRTGLYDDELASAAQRWAKVDRAFQEAVDQGLTTEEGISRMYQEMPQTMGEIKGLEGKLLQQDTMAAAVAFSALKLHHEGKPEESLLVPREVIARYCRGLPDAPSELEAGFLAKVERLAESDPELKRLLEED